jgi:two-component system response regulator AdeR
LHDKTILVAEDSDMIRRLVVAALAPLECTVIEARDGDEAVALATAHLPDLILLDVVMPGMDGFSVLETLRDGGHCPDCAVVMLTTAASQQDHERAEQAGADGYIVKPFEKDELRGTVKAMLSR